jgi:hypothetical protein
MPQSAALVDIQVVKFSIFTPRDIVKIRYGCRLNSRRIGTGKEPLNNFESIRSRSKSRKIDVQIGANSNVIYVIYKTTDIS